MTALLYLVLKLGICGFTPPLLRLSSMVKNGNTDKSVPFVTCIVYTKLRDQFVCLWRDSPQWARASPLTKFLDHTQRRTTVSRTPLDEWSARRRDLYLTTHNNHNRQTSMPPVGFEPTISAGERPQTYALDRAATGTGTYGPVSCRNTYIFFLLPVCLCGEVNRTTTSSDFSVFRCWQINRSPCDMAERMRAYRPLVGVVVRYVVNRKLHPACDVIRPQGSNTNCDFCESCQSK